MDRRVDHEPTKERGDVDERGRDGLVLARARRNRGRARRPARSRRGPVTRAAGKPAPPPARRRNPLPGPSGDGGPAPSGGRRAAGRGIPRARRGRRPDHGERGRIPLRDAARPRRRKGRFVHGQRAGPPQPPLRLDGAGDGRPGRRGPRGPGVRLHGPGA
ncbi:MAG: hypothetical protein F4Z44_03470 [Gemmatimonadetes bacterium]|nr:hypothetical protein [Gemmatimonadota bacterium]